LKDGIGETAFDDAGGFTSAVASGSESIDEG
jgi:hypothetical protein